MPPGEAGHGPAFSLFPHQMSLRSNPSPSPLDYQAMLHEGSSSPSRSSTRHKACGTTPCSRRSGPASVGCSPLRAPRFPTTPLGQVDFEPPSTEDVKLEAEAARELQEGSLSPSGRNQQHEGSSPQGERHEEGFSPDGERLEVGSSPHVGQREEGSSPQQGQRQERSVSSHSAAADPAEAGGTGAAVVTAPETATAGARGAAGLVEAGPAPRPSGPHQVGVSTQAFQGGRRGKLVPYFEQLHRDRRAGLGPPPRRHGRG